MARNISGCRNRGDSGARFGQPIDHPEQRATRPRADAMPQLSPPPIPAPTLRGSHTRAR